MRPSSAGGRRPPPSTPARRRRRGGRGRRRTASRRLRRENSRRRPTARPRAGGGGRDARATTWSAPIILASPTCAAHLSAVHPCESTAGAASPRAAPPPLAPARTAPRSSARTPVVGVAASTFDARYRAAPPPSARGPPSPRHQRRPLAHVVGDRLGVDDAQQRRESASPSRGATVLRGCGPMPTCRDARPRRGAHCANSSTPTLDEAMKPPAPIDADEQRRHDVALQHSASGLRRRISQARRRLRHERSSRSPATQEATAAAAAATASSSSRAIGRGRAGSGRHVHERDASSRERHKPVAVYRAVRRRAHRLVLARSRPRSARGSLAADRDAAADAPGGWPTDATFDSYEDSGYRGAEDIGESAPPPGRRETP